MSILDVGQGILVDDMEGHLRHRYVNGRCVGFITKELIEDAMCSKLWVDSSTVDYLRPFGTYATKQDANTSPT